MLKRIGALLLVLPLLASASAQTQPAALTVDVRLPFRFVAFGDIRIADPRDKNASDATRRQALLKKIAEEDPAFVLISGDLVVNGNKQNWLYWEDETRDWTEQKIRVLPALGNHDVRGGGPALDNFFDHFPDLRGSRWYSARAGNVLLIALDSTGDGVKGEQLDWLMKQLDAIPSDVDFVIFNLHHPPYTRSSDRLSGGHVARASEQALGRMLEEWQGKTRARFLVFSGHVHNYERYERGGVMYVVTGGGGAKPYMIPREPSDFYTEEGPTYHYCLVEADRGKLSLGMYKLEMDGRRARFSKRDSFELTTAKTARAKAANTQP